jgi:hypothetical protein
LVGAYFCNWNFKVLVVWGRVKYDSKDVYFFDWQYWSFGLQKKKMSLVPLIPAC